jgi:hypothetical protein
MERPWMTLNTVEPTTIGKTDPPAQTASKM